MVAGQERQHSRISKVLFSSDRCGISIVEGDQKALGQVPGRGFLTEDVLRQPFGYLVDVEVPNLLAPYIEDRLRDPELELAAVAHSHECKEVVVVSFI